MTFPTHHPPKKTSSFHACASNDLMAVCVRYGPWVWVVLQLQESCKFTSLGCSVHMEKTTNNSRICPTSLTMILRVSNDSLFMYRKSFSQTTKRLNKSLQVRWTSNNGPVHVGSSPSVEKVSSWVIDPYYRYLVKKTCAINQQQCFVSCCVFLKYLLMIA